ncbi:MAG TPA: TonB-dependent receptor plug domain-containing protein [Sphingomonas sp.]|nr:TonB-dependent receptor plug domain-containing protein [Sphingomonas sp.]
MPAFAQSIDYAALQETMGEPVTTSVTGKPQRASETPASIVIITRDQIARSPANDIPGLLKTYAGIDVNRWTAGQSDVAVRGGVQTYNAGLLVLVNGRQVYLDHYGMTNWNLLGVQLEEIQQIELVRGPGTALFGFNAARGVVNIITTDALSETKATGSASIGNHGYNRLSGVATIAVAKNVGLRVSAGHQRERERAFPAILQATVTPPAKRDEIDATLEVAADSRTRIALDGGYSRNRQLEFLPTQNTTVQHFATDTIGLRLDRDTNWGSVSAHGYINRLRSTYGLDLGPFRLHNRIAVAQGSGLVRLGLNNTLRIGVEFRDNRLDSAGQFSPRIDYRVLSGSGMIDLHPTEKMSVTLAARLDRVAAGQKGTPLQPAANLASDFNRTLTRASFNAALLFQTGGEGQLRINGGRGYQLPSLISLGFRLPVQILPPGILLVIAGDPKINPVPVWSAEIGYNRPIASGVSVDVTTFYTRTNNAIAAPANIPDIRISTVSGLVAVAAFESAGSYETYGAELSLTGSLGPLVTWRANYTFTETSANLVYYEKLSLAPQLTTPRHLANLEIGYHPSRWFATSVMRYTSATQQLATGNNLLVGAFPVKAALAWDAKIGFNLSSKLLFTVAGENLTKAGGAAGAPVPADRRVRASIIFKL